MKRDDCIDGLPELVMRIMWPSLPQFIQTEALRYRDVAPLRLKLRIEKAK